MMVKSTISVIVFFAVSLLLPVGVSADPAQIWIDKIQRSASKTNYRGTFVYRQGDQMEVMQVVHRADRNGVRERLVSLNGWAREIIRNKDEVTCYLPDKKTVMVGHGANRNIDKKFLSLMPDRFDQLKDSYSISIASAKSIAGRKTTLVSIQPKDNLRYGYRLWADNKTGLLLKSDLLDNMGKMIEQFMFTNIEIGKPISDKELEPTFSGKGMVWHRSAKKSAKKLESEHWRIGDLPAGYRLTDRMVRNVPGKKQPVTHLLVSDGLAAVSVFIEKSDAGKKVKEMVTSMGAAHAYRASLDGHQITAVGEVPAVTVERIGRSVQKD